MIRRMVQAGLLGAAVVLLIELAALGQTRPGFLLSVASLLLALGLACGLVMGVGEWLVERLRMAPVPAALTRAAGAVPAFLFVSWHLFAGGRAQTMPGADWARLWLPLLGFAGLAATLWMAERVARKRGLRVLLAVPLGLLLASAEIGNRNLYRSEYPDVHAFLVLVSMVSAAAAIYLLLSAGRGAAPVSTSPAHRRRARLITSAAAIAVALGFLATLEYGLDAKRDRWAVATKGMHTRQITRLLRKALDFDGDGYARFLGGGDCDDGDARVSPGALDVPGNGRDEDCDGQDTPLPAPPSEPPPPVTYEEALADWLGEPTARGLTERTAGYHILFVIIDGVRADMLRSNQENRDQFPRLFELADASRRFQFAFAPAAGTDVCVTSMLTGRYNPYVRIDTTMSEALAATGRRVHAVLPREVLRWAGKTMIKRGLTSMDELVTDLERRDVGSHSSSAQTTDLGLAFLDRHAETTPQQPFFLWLHYFDVHEHKQMKTSDPRLREVLDGNESPSRLAKYRAVVEIVDSELGRMVDELRARGLWDRTVVVVVADHGESLGEDPRLPDAHGRFVYNPLVHVPMLIRIPGVRPGVIDRPVSLVNVTPTLLQLAGASLPEGLDADTLLPHLTDGAPEILTERRAPVLLHESEQHGIIAWPHKLLVRPAENLTELFDLERDFAEEHDLSSAEPALTRELAQLYKSYPHLEVVRTRKALNERERLAEPPGPDDSGD